MLTEDELKQIEDRCNVLRDLSGYRFDIADALNDTGKLIAEVRRLREELSKSRFSSSSP